MTTEKRTDWQQKCVDAGFKYWRASDAHGVTCTAAQAVDLLAQLLGVEVEITDAQAAPTSEPKCAVCNGAGVIGTPGAPCEFCKMHRLGLAYKALDAAPALAPDALRKALLDAKRYRCLRELHWFDSNLFVVAGGKSGIRLGVDCPSHDRLDSAVDEIIAKKS